MSQRLKYAVVLLAMTGLSVAFSQKDENDVRMLLTNQVNAWNAGDIDGYMKGYWKSDSTEFVSGGSVTRGYRNVLARYKKSWSFPNCWSGQSRPIWQSRQESGDSNASRISRGDGLP
ncbi:MAG: nuclear transport factor 2 family protein [Bacteroidetes bacterium]|nr:nuclear transport factor 2 family protein [Bacteroidota bacterium]